MYKVGTVMKEIEQLISFTTGAISPVLGSHSMVGVLQDFQN
jgi:hypothetical protein